MSGHPRNQPKSENMELRGSAALIQSERALRRYGCTSCPPYFLRRNFSRRLQLLQLQAADSRDGRECEPVDVLSKRLVHERFDACREVEGLSDTAPAQACREPTHRR